MTNQPMPTTLTETIAKLRGLLANAGKHYDVVVTSKDIADLIGHIEAREFEKPREWWTMGEKEPRHLEVALFRWRDIWRTAKYTKYLHGHRPDWWCKDHCGDEYIKVNESDIWRLMPPAPVIGEGKS